MSIVMSYFCACGFKSGRLEDAQAHADVLATDDRHAVRIAGSITAREEVVNLKAIAASAEKKAREAAILREARKRGVA